MKKTIFTYILILLGFDLVSQDCVQIEIETNGAYTYKIDAESYFFETTRHVFHTTINENKVKSNYKITFRQREVEDKSEELNFKYESNKSIYDFNRLVNIIANSRESSSDIAIRKYSLRGIGNRKYKLDTTYIDTLVNYTVSNITIDQFGYANYNKKELLDDIEIKINELPAKNYISKSNMKNYIETDSLEAYLKIGILNWKPSFLNSESVVSGIIIKWKECNGKYWNVFYRMFSPDGNPKWELYDDKDDTLLCSLINPEIDNILYRLLPYFFYNRERIDEFYSKEMAVKIIIQEIERRILTEEKH